jgi:large subunit ribosomal protein L11
MAKETIEVLVEGGKATAAPPLGPALGPAGVNIGQVVAEINKKTESFKGMQVPVKVIIDSDTKAFEIRVGTPPTSQLIIKEAKIDKGSKNPKEEKIADLKIEQIIKIAKMKEDSLFGKTLKEKAKEVMGTCNGMGILVEGKPARESIADVNAGKFDAEIKAEKTELSAEDMRQLEEEKKKLAEELVKRRDEFIAKAKETISAMQGKDKKVIKLKLRELKIPEDIINELLPPEIGEAVPGAAPGAAAKPGAGAAPQAAPAAAKK